MLTTDDDWRHNCCPLPIEVAGELSRFWSGFGEVFDPKTIKPLAPLVNLLQLSGVVVAVVAISLTVVVVVAAEEVDNDDDDDVDDDVGVLFWLLAADDKLDE